jgi:hypothetical protein
MAGGHLIADGGILVPGGVFEWSSGMLSGSWRVLPGATLELTGADWKRLYSPVDPVYFSNEGIINSRAGTLFVDAWNSPISLTNYGVVNIWHGNDFVAGGGSYSSFFINARGGVVQKVGDSTDAAYFGTYMNQLEFSNFGELRVENGTFHANVIVHGGSIFSGEGTIILGDASIFEEGSILVSNAVLALTGIATDLQNSELTVATAGAGVVEWKSGQLSGTLNVAQGSRLKWASGNLSGTLNIAEGSRVDLVSELPKVLLPNTVVNNRGVLNWNGPGPFVAQHSAPVSVNNLAGGVFNLNTNGNLFGSAWDEAPHRFNNEVGALLRYAPGVVVDFARWEWWQAGESRISNVATSRFWLMKVIPGAKFSGAGVHVFNGSVSLFGPVLADEVTVALNASLYGASTNACLLTTNGGEFEWRAGTLRGTLNIGSNAVFRATGGDEFSHVISGLSEYQTTINNYGQFILDGPAIVLRRWYFNDPPSMWTNQPGSVFEITRDGAVFYLDELGGGFTQSSQFHVAAGATLVKSGGPGAAALTGVQFDNYGTISAQAGVLELGCTVSLNDGSTIGGDAEVRVVSKKTTLNGTTTVDRATLALDGGRMGLCTLSGGAAGGAIAAKNGGVFEWREGALGRVIYFTPGTVTRAVGAGAKDTYGAVINNAGTWFWESSSRLEPWAPASFNNLHGGEFNVISNVFLPDDTSEEVHGFTNAGTLNFFPGRRFGSLWNLRFLPSSRVNLLIGSEAEQQVRIDAPNRTVEVNGALTVSLTNGFVPAAGTVFIVAKYRDRHGEFATTAFPALPAGRHWRLDYGDLPSGTNNHTVSLSVERTALTPGSSTNGQYQFSFSGPPADRCIVDASDDLEAWTPIHTNSPFTGTLLFADPDAVNHTKRFYRIRLEP